MSRTFRGINALFGLGSFRNRLVLCFVKHLQYFCGSMLKPTLHTLCPGTIQLAVTAAHEAFQRILIWELLFDLGFVLQALVASLDDVRRVDAFADCFRELIKLEEAFLRSLEYSGELWVCSGTPCD